MPNIKKDNEFLFNEKQLQHFCKSITNKYDIKIIDFVEYDYINTKNMMDYVFEKNLYKLLIEDDYFINNTFTILIRISDKKDEDDICFCSIKNTYEPFSVLLIRSFIGQQNTIQDVFFIADNTIFLENIDFFELST